MAKELPKYKGLFPMPGTTQWKGIIKFRGKRLEEAILNVLITHSAALEPS